MMLPIGFAIGVIYGKQSSDVLGWRWPMVILALAMVPYAIFMIFAPPLTLRGIAAFSSDAPDVHYSGHGDVGGPGMAAVGDRPLQQLSHGGRLEGAELQADAQPGPAGAGAELRLRSAAVAAQAAAAAAAPEGVVFGAQNRRAGGARLCASVLFVSTCHARMSARASTAPMADPMADPPPSAPRCSTAHMLPHLPRTRRERALFVCRTFLRSLLVLFRNKAFMCMSFAWALHTATVGVFAHFGPKARAPPSVLATAVPRRAPAPASSFARGAAPRRCLSARAPRAGDHGNIQPQVRGPCARRSHGAPGGRAPSRGRDAGPRLLPCWDRRRSEPPALRVHGSLPLPPGVHGRGGDAPRRLCAG